LTAAAPAGTEGGLGSGTEAAFEQHVRVVAADLDERAHVNNIVYLRWAQEIATAHWRALAPPDAAAGLAWVALRHEIDYLAPAFLGDELAIRTWIGGAVGLRFERFTEVRRAADARVLARARTLWCPVDMVTGRPQRVSAELRAIFSHRTDP
jgi:acyl-CoA thioester hydrolase